MSIGRPARDRAGGREEPSATPAIVACTPDSCIAKPHAEAHERVDGDGRHADAPQRDHERECHNCARQSRQRQLVGVEDRDDRNRDDVVAFATVSKNSFTTDDTRSPRSASTPTADAMSVAAGIARPAASGVPALTAMRSPPAAQDAGRSDRRQRRRASLAQHAGDERALDLEADEDRRTAPSTRR
jgi:hypothetical protein